MKRSWMVRLRPPSGVAKGELGLWWAILRQAARDVLVSRNYTLAEEALSFLRGSGKFLYRSLFGIPEQATEEELKRLVTESRALGLKSRVGQDTDPSRI